MSEVKADKRAKVLVVDDETNILRSLKRLLLTRNIKVLAADSGNEALEILKEKKDIAVIISDMRMPGLTGVEVLEKAKKISLDSKRLILTGYADTESAIESINRGGACRYITKPWDNNEFIQTIVELIKIYNLTRENKELTEVVTKQNKALKQWSNRLATLVQEKTKEILSKNKRLKKNFNAFILSLTELIDLRDKTVKNHSRNVAEISTKVAIALKLADEEIENIKIASLLHDIGKIGFPDSLLYKNFEEMTSEEIKEYRLHPVRGQTAIDSIEGLREVGMLIRHHHEKFNGTGFPDGLKGKNIPLGSRIIAIADFIDRAIGKFWEDKIIEATMNKVKNKLNTKFDPYLFKFFPEPVMELHKKNITAYSSFEKEVHLEALRAGMVISKDVISGSGFPLLSKGTVLNASNLKSLRRYYQIDPSKNGIFIFTGKDKKRGE